MGTPVYLVFTTSQHLLSRLIRFFTGGKVTHVELVYPSAELGGWVVMGSQYNGWVLTPFETRDEIMVTAFRIPTHDLWIGIKKNRKWLGSPYDLGALLGMIKVSVWWRLFSRWVRNPGNNKRAWFCSEMARQILTDSGVMLTLRMDQAATSPVSLLEDVAKIPGIVSFDAPTHATIYNDAVTQGFKSA